MKLQASDLTEEQKERQYERHRSLWGINYHSDVVSKESIARFCNNFIGVMENRMKRYEFDDKTKHYLRAEEQLKAYTFMKNVLVGKGK